MSKRMIGIVLACVVCSLFAHSAFSWRSGSSGGDGDFAMFVAPGTIAKSAACNWVTIHTDVAYGAVAGASVAVNDENVDVAQVYSDDRGNAVVKVRFADVVAVVAIAAKPSATVALTLVVDGQPLTASQTVGVTK